ncbi:NAD-dependent epimerase/dehydratase family protein [Promicromonospora sukumoe]|uniref:NAD-dependent epimerase/dehydratase family protein n=1 Tax=Promicromonospora sukumoe TaxID=88382 RepID=UPI000526A70A|nr:NAD-dependent epimerase/dehydratase family protein [Promicromonospora sukumoe]
MRRAVVLGGTGVLGRAVARRLVAAGWQVDLTGRDPARLPADLASAGARHHVADRSDAAATAGLVGDGVDLLVDCLCFTAADARGLLPTLADVGSTVMISSKAVYVDADGNHVNSPVKPRFTGPVREDQPTVPPDESGAYDSAAGYGANKVAAEGVLLDSGHPVTVVRASKVHGEGAVPAREWYFVRRVLDGRRVVLLADGGRGVDHPTAAINLAALVETVADRPGTRVLNSADPDAPSARAIARAVADHLGHSWDEVPLDGSAPTGLGRTPWSTASPIVLDTSAAEALGYRPAGGYAETVGEAIDWLLRTAQEQRTLQHEYFDGSFDYPAEDAFLAALR